MTTPCEKARQLAEDLRKRIDAGEDFAELAKQYSHDPLGAQGGLMRPRAPDAFAAPYDVLAEKAKTVEQGQVAGPIEAPGHFFLMKVERQAGSGISAPGGGPGAGERGNSAGASSCGARGAGGRDRPAGGRRRHDRSS